METQYLIVAGNINEGFCFVGPFKEWDEASEYADKNFVLVSTWISEISVPAEVGK